MTFPSDLTVGLTVGSSRSKLQVVVSFGGSKNSNDIFFTGFWDLGVDGGKLHWSLAI
jgi:hypothetical protein